MEDKDIFTILIDTFPDIREVHDQLEATPTVFLPVAVGGFLESRVKELILLRLVERDATQKFITKSLDYVQAIDLAAALGLLGDVDESVIELRDDLKMIAPLRNVHAHGWNVPLDDPRANEAMLGVVKRLYNWRLGLPKLTEKQMKAKLETYKAESLGKEAPFRGGLLLYALMLTVLLNMAKVCAEAEGVRVKGL